VKRVLTTHTPSGSRVLSVVSDSMILDMEMKLAQHVGDEIVVGSCVSITSGLYANMEGEVMDITSNGNIITRIRMRSLDTLVEIPKSMAVPHDCGGEPNV